MLALKLCVLPYMGTVNVEKWANAREPYDVDLCCTLSAVGQLSSYN